MLIFLCVTGSPRTEKTRVLLANEPRVYREALVDALRRLRPRVELSDVEPDVLDAAVKRFHPHLVVCSRACTAPRNGTLTWVTLYPGRENLAEITTADGRATIVGIQFDHLLSIIDGTEFVRRSARGHGPKACRSVKKAIEEGNL